MTEEPTTVAAARPTETQVPSLELMVAAGITAIPQVGAFLFGGYGHLIVILPVALALTLADIAAVVVAAMQLRADRHARRPTHWLGWITLALAAPCILYSIFLGVDSLIV